MGNYTSNNQNLADKKMMVAENGLENNKLLTLGQQQQQQPATTTADHQQQQQQQQQCKNEIEMKHLNLKKQTIVTMDENDIKMILQTFNVFINQVLQEKLSKMDGANMDDNKTKPSSTATATLVNNNNNNQQYKEPSTQTIFDNLAKMLSTHLGDYLEHCKRTGIVMEPAYKSCTEYIPNNALNNDDNNNNNHHHHYYHHSPQQQSQEQRSTSQQSWQSFNQLVVEQQSNQSGQQQRRMSNFMSLQGTSGNNTMDISQKNKNNLNNLVNMDNIRINLPEILDQQDEVTIMRLLIKLLSNKVRKLSDENRYLLQQISALNDINTELASILQHKFGK